MLTTELKPFDELTPMKDGQKNNSKSENNKDEKSNETIDAPASVKLVEAVKTPDNRLQPNLTKRSSRYWQLCF